MRSLTYRRAATIDVEDAFRILRSSERGLTPDQAKKRRREYGRNAIVLQHASARGVFLRQLKSPFVYLLFAAGVIALLTHQFIDAGMIVLFIAINVFLGFYQEYRAEKAAELLRRFWKNQARVVRGKRTETVDSSELVPGDIITLVAGDKIPADVRFIEAEGLIVDESVLTGEAVTVSKTAQRLDVEPSAYHEALDIGFSGTVVRGGSAKAIVVTTGKASALGGIVALTGETTSIGSFERAISDFSKFILKLIGITLVLLLLTHAGIRGVGQIEELLLFAIALTVGVIPEALPVVMIVVHSKAALELAKHKVIVKRLSSIDDLGSIDVLCTDKTGTLTKNELRLADVFAPDHDACLLDALLASESHGAKEGKMENPFDLALWRAADESVKMHVKNTTQLAEVPFDPAQKMNRVLVKDAGGRHWVIARGSPEAVLANCVGVQNQIELGRYLEREGRLGNRVLAIAKRSTKASEVDALNKSKEWKFMGLVAFEDPLKISAKTAVQRAVRLGVQVKMLTGDAKEVAGSVAERIGLISDPSMVITGEAFDALSSREQHKAVHAYHVFARFDPEQKFQVVSLLQETTAVGFLGEGVNDAPGLKVASVGIAVENASDIAKDAADVILITKSLSIIIDGIELGRKNFANIIKYLQITLSSNFGNFYALAVASLFVPFLPMLPLQILLLNLLTDTPMISIASDAVGPEDLRKPSKYNVKNLILTATVIGVLSSGFDFFTFGVFRGLGEGHLQTLWFMESTLTEIVLIFSLRTSKPFYRGPRVTLFIGSLAFGIIAFTLLLPFSEAGRNLFHFVTPTAGQVTAVLAIVVSYFLVTEAVKLSMVRLMQNHAKSGLRS